MASRRPRSLLEFHRMFPDESECLAYLHALRWPEGFSCESCRAEAHYYYPLRRAVVCRSCRKHVRLTAGTMLHGSRLPLVSWFQAVFLVTTLTPGISAVQLQRQLGLSRYETAFQLLHKIRSALVSPGRETLRGTVEVDEVLIGGVHSGGQRGRSTEKKTLVVGAVEARHGKGRRKRVAGRIRLRVIPNANSATLLAFLQDHVQAKSRVLTDGHLGYRGASDKGYDHRAETAALLPLVHRLFANLKTWLRGTHHDRVERQHLQAYLNEFVFRHNRRFWPFSAFHRAMQLGMGAKGHTYRSLYSADEFGTELHAR